MVVLADEDGGQAPQPGYVERFKTLPLVGSAIAVPAPHDKTSLVDQGEEVAAALLF